MSRIPFILDLGKKIPKKIEQKIEKLETLFPALFLPKTGGDSPKKKKKNLFPNSVHTQLEEENSEKKIAKKGRKLKNLIPALLLAKRG